MENGAASVDGRSCPEEGSVRPWIWGVEPSKLSAGNRSGGGKLPLAVRMIAEIYVSQVLTGSSGGTTLSTSPSGVQ